MWVAQRVGERANNIGAAKDMAIKPQAITATSTEGVLLQEGEQSRSTW